MIISSKIFNDCIHGIIEISPYAMKIINTTAFQRLRHIKQLSTCSYVFHNATHTRFEHSIGVSHLAKQTLYHLRSIHPELKISDKQIHLAEIAGLCHDIGHGPFSHAFDNDFLCNHKDFNKVHPDYKTHEQRSIQILKKIWNETGLYNDFSNTDLCTIINMIDPKPEHNNHFLYNIICNKHSGLDVDKFDYIMRDCKQLGLQYNFNCDRIIKTSIIIGGKIVYPIKEAFNILEMYNLRYRLHKKVYNHNTSKAVEYMIVDIMHHLDKKYNFINMLNPINFDKFLLLTDNIIEFNHKLLLDDKESGGNGLEIFNRISSRNLYKLIDIINVDNNNDINEIYNEVLLKYDDEIKDGLVYIHKLKISLNSEMDSHPITKVLFYNKNDKTKYFKIDNPQDINSLVNGKFYEYVIKVYKK
jgi:HD superfamily phosphohydrolase